MKGYKRARQRLPPRRPKKPSSMRMGQRVHWAHGTMLGLHSRLWKDGVPFEIWIKRQS